MVTRKRPVMVSLTLLVLAVAGAVLAAEYAVDIKSKDGVGSYLADSKGMTLYSFKNDSPGKSSCTGPCSERWPAFYTETVTAPAGIAATDFGMITREDGKKQTTYKGMPLYYFSGDKGPGDVNGHGVKDVWFAAKP